MPFTLKEKHLQRLCLLNGFQIPPAELIFFGLRGCLPTTEDTMTFRTQQQVELTQVDYLHPRCTLGQWRPAEGTFALFPGSTIPNQQNVKNAVLNGGRGSNQLMTGYYKDYRKGVHKVGKPTGHEAFRQTEGRPIHRTADDLDFDNDDRVEFENPFDNLHSGWSMGISHTYSSAGCQVVVGFPKCPQRGNQPDAGPWRVFKENAYSLPQNSFRYFLLNGVDAERVASNENAQLSARLRFGAESPLVTEVQTKLREAGFYEGVTDGFFGERTLRAVMAFQTAKFGRDADDGIVGPTTASALQMNWPNF